MSSQLKLASFSFRPYPLTLSPFTNDSVAIPSSGDDSFLDAKVAKAVKWISSMGTNPIPQLFSEMRPRIVRRLLASVQNAGDLPYAVSTASNQ